MNSLVACILVAVCAGEVLSSQYHGPIATPVVLQNGYLADTHEIAAARTAHLAQLAEESHGYGYSQGYSHDDHDHPKYHGPTAIPHVLHDGHIADTHEVAAAKNHHYAAVANAQAHTSSHGHHGDDGRYAGGYADHNGYESSSNYGGNYGYNHGHEHVYSHDDHGHLRYHGPTAIPHVLHDGHIADTHEVAAAKAEHYAAVSHAKAYAPSHGYHGDDGLYAGGYAGHESSSNYGGNYGYNHGHEHVYSHDDHGHLRYHGPTAIPHVLHDGHIADTHEVAAARAEHYAAVAKAKAHGGYGHDYSGQYATGYGGYHGYSHHVAQSHGPLAKGASPYFGY